MQAKDVVLKGFLCLSVSTCRHCLWGKCFCRTAWKRVFSTRSIIQGSPPHGGLSYGSTYHTGPGRVAHVSYHLHAFHRTSSLFHIQTCFTSTFAFPVRECPEKISCKLCSPRCLFHVCSGLWECRQKSFFLPRKSRGYPTPI